MEEIEYLKLKDIANKLSKLEEDKQLKLLYYLYGIEIAELLNKGVTNEYWIKRKTNCKRWKI